MRKPVLLNPREKKVKDSYFYKYSAEIELGIDSSFLKLLKSLKEGVSYYDPASKRFKENGKWKTKARSQFRIGARELSLLYNEYIKINVND